VHVRSRASLLFTVTALQLTTRSLIIPKKLLPPAQHRLHHKLQKYKKTKFYLLKLVRPNVNQIDLGRKHGSTLAERLNYGENSAIFIVVKFSDMLK